MTPRPRRPPPGAGSVDNLDWPDDAGDLRVTEAKEWDPDALTAYVNGGKKSRRSRGPRPPPPKPPPADVAPDDDETRHLLHFALLQLRAEYAEVVARADAPYASVAAADDRCGPATVAAYEAFDAACAAVAGAGAAADLASCAPLMEVFLTGQCARGDKWMPWHCALGAHERYLLDVVYRLPRAATDRDRYVLGYVFSGSREIELFETLLRPLFEAHASEADAALGQALLNDPLAAMARGGELARRYLAYPRPRRHRLARKF